MDYTQNRNDFKKRRIYSTTPSNQEGFYLSPKVIWLIIILMAIVGLLWFLFNSNYFKIRNINIEGSLNPDVAAEIESLRGKNIFTLVLGNTEEKLTKKQSSIASIEIHRGIPDTLKIKINVREPLISWKTGDKVYLIDKNGIVFQQSEITDNPDKMQKIPQVADSQNININAGGKILTGQFIDFTKTIWQKFHQVTDVNNTEMKIGETTFQLEIETDQGWHALFDTTRNPETELNALKKVLGEHRDQIHEYVDLRVEGRAYLK